MLGKRPRGDEFLLDEDEPDLHILVAGRDAPLMAHYDLLKLYSKCVKGLPRSSDGRPAVWDVRLLVPEGAAEPFAAAVVQDYLDLVYSCIDQSRQVKVFPSLSAVKPLMLFADAAGSTPVVFDKLAQALVGNEDLCMDVDVGEDLHVSLHLQGRLYMLSASLGLTYTRVPYGVSREVVAPLSELPVARMQQFVAAVCAALEEWLYLAGRLGMVPLARLLINFVKMQAVPDNLSIVVADLGAAKGIYSRRVLQCMPPELLLEGFLRDAFSDVPSAESSQMMGSKPSRSSLMSSGVFAPGAACWKYAAAVGEVRVVLTSSASSLTTSD